MNYQKERPGLASEESSGQVFLHFLPLMQHLGRSFEPSAPGKVYLAQ